MENKALDTAKTVLATRAYVFVDAAGDDMKLLAEALLAMHEKLEDAIDVRDAFIAKNEMLEVESTRLSGTGMHLAAQFDRCEADLKEALDVLRFYAEYTNHAQQTEHDEKIGFVNYVPIIRDCGQRAREFIAKHEGKEKE